MTIETIKAKFHEALHLDYSREDIDLFYRIYSEDRLGLEAQEFETAEVKLTDSELATDLEAILNGTPIQQVVGKAFFYEHTFFVNRHTLIPRPETEELIALIANDYSEKCPSSFIDLGTGSGCIPISLAKVFPSSEAYALDVSEDALMVAKKNAQQLEAPITFVHKSLLDDLNLERSFELIISNPPYIRELEKVAMEANVLDFEPHLALFVSDEDPLIFYRRIALFATKHLALNGRIYCEINQYLGAETKAMFEEYFTSVDLLQDISGNDRMIRAY